eukprot:TRINITY_DN441_c0_g2_i10.p2 TRINITY_DN441_c0_g2~~TRINITY_DN441_c0_g2_i10.p2  ORF type:complete len:136 (+),score=9.96 TRINITY_DN441_c0_g2_i10:1137-1544(+)
MASLAMVVGGAVVNALAFSGSNYMFSKLQSKEERIRHNKAIEQLAAAQNVYEKQRIEQLDFINETLKQQGHAAYTYRNVDAAIKEYFLVTGKPIEQSKPPVLSDFYQPTEKQKVQEIVFIVIGMSAVYFIAQKIV